MGLRHGFWPSCFTMSWDFICFGFVLYCGVRVFLGRPLQASFHSLLFLSSLRSSSPLKSASVCPQIYSFSDMIIRKVLMDRIVLWVSFVFFFLCQWLSFCTVRFKKFKWIKLSCTYIYKNTSTVVCLFDGFFLPYQILTHRLVSIFLFHNVFYFVKNIYKY